MFEQSKVKIKQLLIWCQKYTKTDMVYLAKGGFWLMAGQFSASAIGLIASLFFANLLLPSTYGVYRYILTLGEIITIFSLSGLDLAIVPAAARGLDSVLRYAFRTSLRWGSLMLIAGWSASFYYYFKGNATLSLGLFVLGIVMPLISSANLSGAFLEGKKNFKKSVTYSIINNLLRTTAVLLAMFFTTNPAILATVYLGAYTISSLVIYRKVVKGTPAGEHNETIRFGKHLSVINIISLIGEHIDKVLIFQHIGAAELAIYSFASLVPDQGRNVLKKIITLSLPKLSTKNDAQIKTAVFKKLLTSMVFLIPATLCYMALAPFIYKFFFPQYTASAPLSQFFALTFLLYGNLGNTALVAKKAIKERYTVEATTAIIRIILMFTLIVPYGLWGVVISKVASKYIGNALVLYFIKRGGSALPPAKMTCDTDSQSDAHLSGPNLE